MTRPALQESLFDFQLPDNTPVVDRKITPGCFLPIPANQVVDVRRASSILDLPPRKIPELRDAGLLRGYRDGSVWMIDYSSIVEFCDQLRVTYHIADRRPKVRPVSRWRDADLLPFPLQDTVTSAEAAIGLSTTRFQVLRMCEEGRFEAYRIQPLASWQWRISKTSLFAYRDRKKAELLGQVRRRV